MQAMVKKILEASTVEIHIGWKHRISNRLQQANSPTHLKLKYQGKKTTTI
jgi:hypothetical protein